MYLLNEHLYILHLEHMSGAILSVLQLFTRVTFSSCFEAEWVCYLAKSIS